MRSVPARTIYAAIALGFFGQACVSFKTLEPDVVTLTAAPVPAVITQADIAGGRYVFSGTLTRQSPKAKLGATVEVRDNGVLIGAITVTDETTWAIEWRVPQDRDAEPHTIAIGGQDSLGRTLDGAVSVDIVLASAGPKLVAFEATPAATAGSVDVAWAIAGPVAYQEIVLGELRWFFPADVRTAQLVALPLHATHRLALRASLENGNVTTLERDVTLP